MEKLIYLVGVEPSRDASEFREFLLADLAPRLIRGGAMRLTINVADLATIYDQHLVLTIPINDAFGVLDASISFWLNSLDDRLELEKAISEQARRWCGYSVTESVPIEYKEVSWAAGTRSPGVTIVAAFPKPDWLDDDEFYRHWHGSHTPLSLEIHPLSRYLRHTVARGLARDSPPFRAIVEERVNSLEELVEEKLFFRGVGAKQRMEDDLVKFVNMEQCQSMAMSEYIMS